MDRLGRHCLNRGMLDSTHGFDDSETASASRARQVADPEPNTGGIASDRLRSLIERLERLQEEKQALGSDIKDIFAEAKSAGFDVPIIRQLLKLRQREPAEIAEQESLLDVYRRALGM